MLSIIVSLLLLHSGLTEVEEYKISPEECRQAGFVPESLKCDSCHKLGDFNLDTLMTDCLGCCTKEKELEHEKYPLAIMEVCECNLGRFPQMQAFVHNDMAAAWGGRVKVRHVRGVRPTIILKDANGVSRQTLNVEKWDTDTLTGFLNEWVQ